MIATGTPGSAKSGGAAASLMARARTRWPHAIALSLVLLVLATAAVLGYRAIDRELTSSALSRRTSVSDLAAATLSEKFDRLSDIGVSLATRVRFRQLVAAEKWTEASEILRDVPRDLPFIERLFLADVKGTLTADVPELPNVRGRNFAERDWYKGVSLEWKPYISPLYRRAAVPQRKVFAVAVPIRSEAGAVSGILVMQMRPEIFFEWAKSVEIGPGGIVYVVDPNGKVAIHSVSPLLQEQFLDFSSVPVVQRVLRGDRGVEVAYDPVETKNSVSAYTPVARYGWGVVVQQPSQAAFATRNSQLRWVLISYGLISLFLLVMVYLSFHIAVQRRQAEEDRRIQADLEYRVAERTAQLRAVTDTANDAIISADADGRIVYFNQGAERMFGRSAEEASGQPLTLLMPTRIQEAHAAGFARFLATRQPHVIGKTVEMIAMKSDGTEVPVELSLANWTTDQGMFFTAILRDITAHKEAENVLRNINEQLKAANKDLEGFSYSVSHDLRSPLRAIDGFSRILTENYGDKLDDEGRRLLGVVRDNSRKMGELVDDLLEFSRLGRKPLSFAEMNMKHLVEDVLKEAPAPGERPPQFRIDALPPAHGDAVIIKQVWANLLDNAIKFSAKRKQPLIEVKGFENGAEGVYCVKDNGAGFDMRYYDKLFGVFQRLHSEAEFSGTGVGLAIVQRIVTRHGGRVWAEGRVDGGAAFYFSLPKGRSDG